LWLRPVQVGGALSLIMQAEIVRKLRRILRRVLGRSRHERDGRISGLGTLLEQGGQTASCIW